jgi:glycosyltransferase involved in cell wall biosynthesis
MTTSNLQIFVLSRDRVDYLRQTLDSVLQQSGDGIEVVISDNSERDDVSRMLEREFPDVRRIRRWPALGAFDHFRAVIEEASADLVVLFHDDDLLLPGYAQTLRGHFEQHPSLSAVCCNAAIRRGDAATTELFAPVRGPFVELSTPEALLATYFSLSLKGPAPFPGYMYRRAHLQGLFLDPRHGGKYSDVSFLLKLLARGPIRWLGEPLMQYRIHDHNDSATEAVGQRLRLLRYVYETTRVRPHSRLVSQYRYRYWTSWLRSHSSQSRATPWRRGIVSRFVLSRSVLYALTAPAIWSRAVGKLSRIARQRLNPAKTA